MLQRLWAATHQDLVKDVGKTFGPDIHSLPDWPFPTSDNDNEAALSVDYSYGLGYQLPAFLRQAGQQNTAMIETIELWFGDLTSSFELVPIYAEILRQHTPLLRRLNVGTTILVQAI